MVTEDSVDKTGSGSGLSTCDGSNLDMILYELAHRHGGGGEDGVRVNGDGRGVPVRVEWWW
jgi:hypothetical protein